MYTNLFSKLWARIRNYGSMLCRCWTNASSNRQQTAPLPPQGDFWYRMIVSFWISKWIICKITISRQERDLCRFIVGSPSQTVAHHQTDIGSKSRACGIYPTAYCHYQSKNGHFYGLRLPRCIYPGDTEETCDERRPISLKWHIPLISPSAASSTEARLDVLFTIRKFQLRERLIVPGIPDYQQA